MGVAGKLESVTPVEYSSALNALSNTTTTTTTSSSSSGNSTAQKGMNLDSVVGSGSASDYEEARLVLERANNDAKLKETTVTSTTVNNANKPSRSVTCPDQLHRLVAVQMASSHKETCTRLAALIQERMDSLRASLNW